MEEENFTEQILLNIRLGNPILNDSWLEDYASDSNTHFCRNTMYNRTKIIQSRRVR